MDDDRLRRLFAARRSRLDNTPSFGSVVRRPAPRRTIRPLVLATAAACLLVVVALWPDEAPRSISVAAGELMAWQAPTDVLLDFDLGIGPVPEEGTVTP